MISKREKDKGVKRGKERGRDREISGHNFAIRTSCLPLLYSIQPKPGQRKIIRWGETEGERSKQR